MRRLVHDHDFQPNLTVHEFFPSCAIPVLGRGLIEHGLAWSCCGSQPLRGGCGAPSAQTPKLTMCFGFGHSWLHFRAVSAM